jgi:phosphoadenosine phosphosulfate reductase
MIAHTPATAPAYTPTWLPANLPRISHRFEQRGPRELLRWGLATYGEEIVLATGFGLSGIVLMHLVAGLRPGTAVFYLQTDLHFPETMALRDRLAERLGLRFIEIRPEMSLSDQQRQYGPELWRHNPDLCCQLRKVQPLRRFLADKKGWITGIRRDQSPTRSRTSLVEWDQANQIVKLNPLAAWSRELVWRYIEQHGLPYNSLRDQGYASIGCRPCTRSINAGEDERAGRWAGLSKTECGIHLAHANGEQK